MLILSERQYTKILAHVRKSLPLEACGLMAGKGKTVEKIYLISNQLKSPTRFLMDPLEMLQSFQEMEKDGNELLAMFHSHPKGPDHPSPTDIAEFTYPGILSLIIFPSEQGFAMKAYKIESDVFIETAWSFASIL